MITPIEFSILVFGVPVLMIVLAELYLSIKYPVRYEDLFLKKIDLIYDSNALFIRCKDT